MEINAVDTNVVVRFLTHDDPNQFKLADEIFKSTLPFIPDSVWLETEWVLRYAYNFDAKSIIRAFRRLLGLPQVRVRDANRLLNAIAWHEAGLDFADALHLACVQNFDKIFTFDKTFAKRSINKGVCTVKHLTVQE